MPNILNKLRDLITDPSHWTQQIGAVDAKGIPTYPEDPNAVAFCIVGGLAHLIRTGKARGLDQPKALTDLQREAGGSLVVFNDTHTHAEVLDLIDRTIIDMDKEFADADHA